MVAVERTHRLAKFLRAAVAVKSKPVVEANQYPHVLWFSQMPTAFDGLRSPLISEDWPDDDFDWLSVHRVTEPPVPEPPNACTPWLRGVVLGDPESRPVLNRQRIEPGEVEGQTVEIYLPEEVDAEFAQFLERRWDSWAAKARAARAVGPTYRKLFAIIQELKGKEDAFDFFLGVGLIDSRLDPAQRLHRHVLAFPAEARLDEKSGVIRVGPSPESVVPRVEVEFLPPEQRRRIEEVADRQKEEIAALWPDARERDGLRDVLLKFANQCHPDAVYAGGPKEAHTPAGGLNVSFAPALIMRPRSSRSLDALLERIEKQSGGPEPALDADQLPNAWLRMVEDGRAWEGAGGNVAPGAASAPDVRTFFPLPCNEEQLKIVRYARGSAGVVVQGPPGTGKSHTIANLISHYLATGQRVLVTAQSPQALEVLRDKMPAELRDLCVCLLGDSRQGQKDLQKSVRGILARRQDLEHKNYHQDISRLETSLEKAERDVAELDRRLADSRASETTTLEPVPGYRGTKAAIAMKVGQERDGYKWLGDEIQPNSTCPQYFGGWARLADYHAALTDQIREGLNKTLIPLPFTADEAQAVVRGIGALLADGSWCAAPDAGCAVPPSLGADSLKALSEWLLRLADIERGQPAGDWWASLRTELLGVDRSKWGALRDELDAALAKLSDAVVADTVPVEVAGRSLAEAHRALTSLSAHYAQGGKRRVLFFFKPKAVKQSDWVEQAVTVAGAHAVAPSDVDRARRACKGWTLLSDAWTVWGEWGTKRAGTPRQQYAELVARRAVLQRALEHGNAADALDGPLREWLLDVLRRQCATDALRRAVKGRSDALALERLRRTRDEMARDLQRAADGKVVVPAIEQVRAALLAEDEPALEIALEALVLEDVKRKEHQPYQQFIRAVETAAPKLAADIQGAEGTPLWRQRFAGFETAWDHGRAAGWLRDLVSKDEIEAVERVARDQRQQAQDVLRELVAERAWNEALGRIHDARRASLVAWAKAVAAIPATGKSVFHKRAVARSYLSSCLDAIPAWVVSLGRLYETVDPKPGLFDIAIVDEASQCWLDSLLLFYLAKKVIVVGDDKQISPTVVGIGDMQIAELANTYLGDLAFRGSFSLESSLFDHAQRYLSAGIPLREHFRCVPEIIRFSNELCYSDRPLIPLRSVGADRLEPLKRTFLSDGFRKGDVNEREAEKIVEAIAYCHVDAAYEGTSFGVICLQGDAQAKRIEQMILDRWGPEIFQQRDLRCGNPYAFQGDERDVIFLSMVVAPNVQHASLTGARYEQRFNVALSRGRDQLWLFHSVEEGELGPNCLRRRVLEFFRTPLDQTIGGVSLDIPTIRLQATRAVRTVERPPKPFDSWFEVDVALALAAKGFRLSAQVAVGTKRIDLVVEGADGARLAVECDGDAWHGPEQHDQDVFRQRQLERVEWRFVRVRESIFRADEPKAVAAVVAAAEEQGIFLAGSSRLAVTPPPAAISVEEPDPSVGHAWTPVSVRPAGIPIDSATIEVDAGAVDQEDDDDELEGHPVTDEAEEDEPVPSPGTGPFTGYEGKDYPDPRSAPPANIRVALLDIVNTDGPLPKQAIYRLYRDGCPRMGGVGKIARKAINSALQYLERRGDLESRDEGIRRSIAEVVFKTKDQPWVSVREAGARGLDDVPLSELAEAAKRRDPKWHSRTAEVRLETLKEAVRAYGVRRFRQTAIERLAAVAQFIDRTESTTGPATPPSSPASLDRV